MRVYLGSDHAGFDTKKVIVEHLQPTGHEPIDVGAHEMDPADDYPAYCLEAARRTMDDEGSLGIVLGGSGNGEQIAANKVPGVRCALCWSVEIAKLARQHNNANMLSLGGRFLSDEEALAIVDAFLQEPWSNEDRHQRRIDIIGEFEKSHEYPALPDKA